MQNIPIFGRRVTQMREQRGLSIQALADKVGTSYQTIWRIERGVHGEPGVYMARRIARALECSLDYLCALYDDEDEVSQLVGAIA